MSSESYHEPYDALSPDTRDAHRAIVTLMEELEAIDWYQQRAEACHDEELKAVLLHNKDEEIEHAMMVLEWLRRRTVAFDENIRTYLNAGGSITEVEAEKDVAAGAAGAPGGAGGSLGIGSLKEG